MKRLLLLALLVAVAPFVLTFILAVTSCENGGIPKPIVDVSLKDKPLSVIKANIQGDWKLHKIHGGICGTCCQKRENEFCTLVNDRIKWETNGIIVTDTTVIWVNYDVFGDTSWTMSYYDKQMRPNYLTPDGIHKDTLILYQKGPDGLYFHFTKVEH